MAGLFVTGTGTDIGKTYISALIVKALAKSGASCAYFKAAVSGNERGADGSLIPGDALKVKGVSLIEQDVGTMCPYVYERAFSPHLAAQIEGNPVEPDTVKKCYDKLCEKYDYITVEGSGGIICPIRFDDKKIMLEDIINLLGLECVIVADAGLGTINNVVLTTEHMKSRNIAIKGIIFNHFRTGDTMHEDNVKMCEALTGLPVIARVCDGASELDMDAEFLKSLYNLSKDVPRL